MTFEGRMIGLFTARLGVLETLVLVSRRGLMKFESPGLALEGPWSWFSLVCGL